MEIFLDILLGALLVALLGTGLYLGYFRSKSGVPAADKEESQENATEKIKRQSVKTRKKYADLPFGKIALGLVLAAGLAYIFVHWSAITDQRTKATTTVVKHETSVVVGRASDSATSDKSAEEVVAQTKIESQHYTVELTDGVMPDWIRVPEGFEFKGHVKGLPEGKTTIGWQCSSAYEEPPPDADGEEYWCDFDDLKARWIRPYIYQHEEETASLDYHFRHL